MNKKSILKNTICIMLSIAVIISMSGCTSFNNSSLKRLLYMEAFGVDMDQEKGEYSCTTQIFDPMMGAATIQEQDKPITRVIETTGESISAAVAAMTEQIGRKPYYSQNKVIVIGEEIAKEGITSMTDYFDRDWETRLTMQVLIGSPDASGIVKSTLGDVINPAEELQLIAQAGNVNGRVPQCTVLDIKKALSDKYTDFCIPVVKAEGEGEDSKVTVESIAVFKGDKIAGYIPYDDARGVLLLNDEIEKTIFVIKIKGVGNASMNIINSKTDLKVNIENDEIVCDVYVKCEANIPEINIEDDSIEILNEIDNIQDECEKQIIKEMDNAAELTVNEMGCDIYGIGRRLMYNERDYWEKIKNNWNEEIKNVKFRYHVEAEINRIGETVNQKSKQN